MSVVNNNLIFSGNILADDVLLNGNIYREYSFDVFKLSSTTNASPTFDYADRTYTFHASRKNTLGGSFKLPSNRKLNTNVIFRVVLKTSSTSTNTGLLYLELNYKWTSNNTIMTSSPTTYNNLISVPSGSANYLFITDFCNFDYPNNISNDSIIHWDFSRLSQLSQDTYESTIKLQTISFLVQIDRI